MKNDGTFCGSIGERRLNIGFYANEEMKRKKGKKGRSSK